MRGRGGLKTKKKNTMWAGAGWVGDLGVFAGLPCNRPVAIHSRWDWYVA